MQGYEVTQSSTAYPLVFLMISSTDHISPATGLSPTVTISKNGGSFASPSGAVTEIANGWYKVAGNATDTATLGPLILHATSSGADPSDSVFPVIAVNPQSTAFGLSLAKTTNITGFNDIAATSIVTGGAISTSAGTVSAVATVGSVGGNVTGSVGSISGVTFPSGFSGLTAGAIATAVLTDTGDNSTTGSPGKILAQLLGAFTTSTSSVFSTASLANAPSGGSGGLSLTTTLNAARALDSIADTSLTVNDALQCAVAAVTAQVDASSGTSCVFKTASTGTTLRTKTLTTITAPTTVVDKAV